MSGIHGELDLYYRIFIVNYKTRLQKENMVSGIIKRYIYDYKTDVKLRRSIKYFDVSFFVKFTVLL